MARKKRSFSVADALNAFSKTYTTTRGVLQDRDMAKAANASVTEDTGFVAEQGEQLNAIANAKDEQGNNFYNVSATEDGKYQVTPNKQVFEARGAGADMTNSVSEIAPGARYSILGQTRDKPFTDNEQDSIRTRAMAGVFSKYGDPAKAMQLRTQAGQLDNQALQAQQAQQGLELGKFQIGAAERASRAGARQDAATEAITEAGLKQSEAAAQSGNYSQYQRDLARAVSPGGKPGEDGIADAVRANPNNASVAKIAGSQGVEAMVRANAGPGANESEIQQAITAYKQSIGDAQANQNAASMKSLYEHQSKIWNGVGGDPVRAAAALKMAEAEGMPQVIEQLKAGNVDAANKIWNSSGQGKGIITEIGKDGKGNLYATIIDPFSGQQSRESVTDMERQLLSLKELTGIKAGEANIAQSEAGVRASEANIVQGQASTAQGWQRVGNDTRSTNAAVARSGVETASANAELNYIRKNGVKMGTGTSATERLPAGAKVKIDVMKGAISDLYKQRAEAEKNGDTDAVAALGGQIESAITRVNDMAEGKPLGAQAAPAAGLAVGTTRLIGGRKAQWDGRGWKASN